MAKKTANKKTGTLKPKSAKQAVAQEALQTTWLLKGNLKNVQLSYLRVGKLLSQVREKKMFEALGHPDIEDYAEKRLQLGRTSLFKYLRVYDWTCKNHPEWVQPKPKGFIPDLSDMADVITIENELAKKDVAPGDRKALESLKQKALTGNLKQGEVAKLNRQRRTNADSIKAYVSKLKSLRLKGFQMATMPKEVIEHLDAAIAILKNEQSVAHLIMMPGIMPKIRNGLFLA